jgi:tetratricopeptide (TPR) repeat protein
VAAEIVRTQIAGLALKARQFLHSELVRAAGAHYSHWAERVHSVAVVAAVLADFLYPFVDGPFYAFVLTLAVLPMLAAAAWRGWIKADIALAAALFLVVAGAMFGGLQLTEKWVGDKHGIVGKLLPPIETLQDQLEKLLKGQEEQGKDIKEIKEQQSQIVFQNQAVLEEIRRAKGVPYSVLANVLTRLGETALADDPVQIEKKLNEMADEYLALKTQLAALASDDKRVAALREQAAAAVEAADFDGARAKLRQAAEIDRAAVNDLAGRARARSLGAATSLEQSARAARLALRYTAAAGDLDEAAQLALPYDRMEAWRHRLAQADALNAQGNEFGENGALEQAIALLRDVRALVPQADHAQEWAATQNNLGNALQVLGERKGDEALLAQAVEAYRDALKERTRDRARLDWAVTKNNRSLHRLNRAPWTRWPAQA